MTIETKLQLVENLWKDLCNRPFSLKDLSASLVRDCGHDACGVTPDDIEALCSEQEEKHLKEMAVVFDEVLAFYLAGEMKGETFVKAIFSALMLSHVIALGYGDWGFSFDKMLDLLCGNRRQGGYEFRMNFLKEILVSGTDQTTDPGVRALGFGG